MKIKIKSRPSINGNFTIGSKISIVTKPTRWSSILGGVCPHKLNYPIIGVIHDIYFNEELSTVNVLYNGIIYGFSLPWLEKNAYIYEDKV